MSGPAQEWSDVAAAWDRSVGYVDDHSTAATEALIDRLGIQEGDRLLELAAGPGSLGRRWAQLVGDRGQVVLSDIAPGMVEMARRRNAAHPNVQVATIDAAAIDHPDAAFDVVVCRMGLMFTPDPAVAFAEIHRVLRPGGRLGALTWAGIEHNPWMTCVGMAAMANGVVAGAPPVAPGGIFSLGDPARLEALAKEAGFVDVAAEEVPLTFAAPDIETHVSRISSLAGPLAAAFEAASPDQLEAVRRTATELAAPHATDDGYLLPGRALLLVAHRR